MKHSDPPGILGDMDSARDVIRKYVRGALPYPDLLRRGRTRRAAARLITCKLWQGENATGMDGAQLALLRLLYLQQVTRTAVSERRAEDAALLARGSIETAIVGLYCLHSGDAIADLSAASYRPAGRDGSYLSDASLRSRSAIDGAVAALGELGPDLNVRDLALWLEREQELVQAATLYHSYYVPLSHLFSRSYAFALMRHVHPDGSLQRSPVFQWTRTSAARIADGCTGLLAANIADVSGGEPEPFLRYATAHFDRALTPAFAFAVKGARRTGPLRKFPATLAALVATQARTGQLDAGEYRQDGQYSPQDQHREYEPSDQYREFREYDSDGQYGGFAGMLDPLAPDSSGVVLPMPGSDGNGVPAWNTDPGDDRQARHRRPYSG